MPRTSEELETAAAETERWLDELDPAVLDDPASRADDLRAITSARDVIAVGEHQLATAVAAARANGRSWGEIGLFLGVSKQAARKRFGGEVHGPTGAATGTEVVTVLSAAALTGMVYALARKEADESERGEAPEGEAATPRWLDELLTVGVPQGPGVFFGSDEVFVRFPTPRLPIDGDTARKWNQWLKDLSETIAKFPEMPAGSSPGHTRRGA